MKKTILIILILSFISLTFAGAVIVEWKADPQENKVVLHWKTSQEENLQKFVIERSADNQNFSQLGEIQSRGPGFNYNYEDHDIGRLKSMFYYRLKLVNNDGSTQYTDALPVIPNITSLTRTWGSIKALFR